MKKVLLKILILSVDVMYQNQTNRETFSCLDFNPANPLSLLYSVAGTPDIDIIWRELLRRGDDYYSLTFEYIKLKL